MAKDPNILQRSTVPKEIVDTAVEFAASNQAADHALLLRSLNTAAFLNRIDTEQEAIASPPKRLRIAKVIKTLMDNPAPESKQTISALARGRDFIAFEPRQWLLVRALVEVRPATPEAVAFWDQQSVPDSIHLHLTIQALCDNGTDPALALLEKKLADPAHDLDFRLIWMRSYVLVHRNDLPMLQACERMITTTLPEEIRPYLVEALCDYKREWYLSCKPPKPPTRVLATKPARLKLKQICEFAKDKLNLNPSIRAAVERTLLELDAIT